MKNRGRVIQGRGKYQVEYRGDYRVDYRVDYWILGQFLGEKVEFLLKSG